MIQRIKFLCILSSIIVGFLIFSHQVSAYINCTDGIAAACDSPGQTDNPGLGSGTAGPQNTFSQSARFSCDAFGNAFTGQGSVVDCQQAFNLARLGQVYKITYTLERNDSPPVQVNWCINNTGLWDGSGACGTVQDQNTGQINFPKTLWINDYPTNTAQYRYMIIHARAEATATNDNNFTGIFTMYRRAVQISSFDTSTSSISPGNSPNFSFQVYNATPNAELYVRMSGPTGGDYQLTQCTSVEECSAGNWSLPATLTTAGIYTFVLHAGGPSQDGGFTRVESSPITVEVTSTPTPNTLTCTITSSATGQPVSGAICSIAGQSGTTDESGKKTFTGISPGTYTLTVTASGYSSYSGSHSIGSGATNIPVSLTPSSGTPPGPPGQNRTLKVTINGPGQVTSSYGACTTSTSPCSIQIPKDTSVSITAQTVNGSTFTGWGEICSSFGIQTTCIGNMSVDRNATANFSGPSGPSGTISATSCVIALNASTCTDTNVTWTTANLTSGTTEVTRNNPNNTHVSWATSGTNEDYAVNYGATTFYLYFNGGEPPLASASINATCVSGSSWIGGKCASNTPPPPTSPSGTISATSCTIASNASTCSSAVSWSTYNLTSGPTEVKRNNPNNTHVSWATSASNVSATVNVGATTFYLYHNNAASPLASASINATCASGTAWDGNSNKCKASNPPPNQMSGTLTGPSSCAIASGANSCSVTLSWSIAYPEAVPTTITALGMSNINVSNTLSTPQSGTQVVTVPFSSRTFYLYNNNIPLAQTGVASSCASSTDWDGSKCASAASSAATVCVTTDTQDAYVFNHFSMPRSWGWNGSQCFTDAPSDQKGGWYRVEQYPGGLAPYSNSGEVWLPPGGHGDISIKFITPPVCAANQGNSCTSIPNSCGQTNIGTISCDGSCSAATPPNNSCPTGSVTGTLTPQTPSCIIPIGASSCNINFSWTTTTN